MTTIRPLDGIRVIEIASFIAGPYCTAQMAEFGAEVIKLELPGAGDALRRFGSPSPAGDSVQWLSECRNKQVATLDIRTPGRRRNPQTPRRARPISSSRTSSPAPSRNGASAGTSCAPSNPRLVMVRISGYGQTGPYSARPGFGRIGNAFGGLSFLAGYPDRPPVTPGSATIPDYLAGIYGAYGALMALRARDLTGEGQVVDIGLYEPVFRILDELAAAYHQNGTIRQRMGPGTVNVVPHSHYPTRDNRWIAIACTNDKIFARLAEAMGNPALASPERWGTLAARERDRPAVDAKVGAWTADMTRDEALAHCAKFEVPCGPVYAIDEIFNDPHYAARGNIAFIQDPRAGEVAVPAPVPRLTATPGRIDHLGPALGADTETIYARLLNIGPEELAALRAKGVV